MPDQGPGHKEAPQGQDSEPGQEEQADDEAEGGDIAQKERGCRHSDNYTEEPSDGRYHETCPHFDRG